VSGIETETVRAELLSPAELDARLSQQSIVYLPLGTLEFHGPHLPIGLDALTAHGVCVDAASRAGGVVAPAVYQGFGGGHGRYPWTIMMADGEGIAAHLRATFARLEDFAVETAVVFSGHFAPEQLDLIDRVAAEWNGDGTHALRVVATAVNRCESAPLAPDHAGRFETTLLAGIRPDLVRLDRLPGLEEHPADDPGDDAYGEHRHERDHPLWGVFGPDPRGADLAEGSRLLGHLGEWLAGLATGSAAAGA